MKKKYKIDKLFLNNLFKNIKIRIIFNNNITATHNYLKAKRLLFMN